MARERTMENGHEPATKADLQELGQQLRSEIRDNVEQLRSEFHHEFDDLRESFRDGQTELLKAFYNFAQTIEIKLRDGEQSDIALRQRLSAVEVRLTEVEKRLHLPPASASS
jgi:hypothetical protein